MQPNFQDYGLHRPQRLARIFGSALVVGWVPLITAIVAEHSRVGQSDPHGLSAALSIAILTSAASLSLGAFVGLLFAIPNQRYSKQRSRYLPRWVQNSNLERVADWATKILVGILLVSASRLLDGNFRIPELITVAGATPAWNRAITAVSTTYFTATGLFVGYFCSRIFLTEQFFLARQVDSLEVDDDDDSDAPSLTTQRNLVDQVASLANLIASLQLHPLLDNFDGAVSVRFFERDGGPLELTQAEAGGAVAIATPGMRCVAVVTLESGGNSNGEPFRQAVKIVDGNQAPQAVTFFIAAESDHMMFEPAYQTCTFEPAEGDAELSFAFAAPERADVTSPTKSNRYEIFFEVSQKNRLIQVLRATLIVAG